MAKLGVQAKARINARLAVSDLAEAAELPGVTEAEVQEAATVVTPYLHGDGVTKLWSLHRLSLVLGVVRPYATRKLAG
jgi:hypothetical protein